MNNARSKNAAKNLGAAWIGQLIIMLVKFLARLVFVKILTADYLGLNGLFTSLLTMLSLAELGVGNAINFSLYRPIAEGDNEKIKTLMAFYKKAYTVIGVVIAVVGIGLAPFISFFIKDLPNIPNISLIYLMFVANTSISYFFSYKAALIAASQKNYIVSVNHYLFATLLNAAQVVVLLLTKNFFLFLGCQLIFTLFENASIAIKAEKLFPLLKEKEVQPLDVETSSTIKRNTFAMMMHKVGSIVVNATDNVLISKLIGIASVGIYSNYLLIIVTLQSILNHLFNAIIAGVGNLNVTADIDKKHDVFNISFLVGFWVYSVCSICLLVLVQPVILIAFGEGYLYPNEVMFAVVLNFYLMGMRQAVLSFKAAMGLFWNDRYKAIFESIINLVASIILASFMGIIGIFIGTAFSTITTSLWVEPYMLYKYGFHKPVSGYFIKFGAYTLVACIGAIITFIACSYIAIGGMFGLLIKAAACFLISNTVFAILLFRTPEFIQMLHMARKLIKKC